MSWTLASIAVKCDITLDGTLMSAVFPSMKPTDYILVRVVSVSHTS